MHRDVLDRASRALWEEIRSLLARQRRLAGRGAGDLECVRVRERLLALKALSARYREVQRREAWARWEGG
jgi:hypothetical protein